MAEEFRFSAKDNLSMKARQLEALLDTITGQGFESFSNMSEDIQANVLWLAQALATEIRELTTAVLFPGSAAG